MDRLGLTGAETVGHEPHRPNLIIRLGNQTAGPTLMLCGHTDTKPVGDSTDWKTDPLDAVVRDGKLYGLGSTDMKGAVAAMIYATDFSQKDGLNEAWTEWLSPEQLPVRAFIGVAELGKDVLVEIVVTAAK